MLQVKISQAIGMIVRCIKARLVPMVVGSPGCGKSQIVHQIAAQFNLKVIDLRLSQCDPTDLLGFPSIVKERASYVAMDTFPIEGDAIPDGYTGWMLFLDEFNAASVAVQAAAYKLVLDRMVGKHHLHKNVAIVCAGNLDTDNAIVQTLSTALQSRLVHMEVLVDQKEWDVWATGAGLDHRITSYIKYRPASLFTFSPDHTDKTYACPRTWEFANRFIQDDTDLSAPEMLPLLAGTLSEGVAREFLSFTKIYKDLPRLEDIIAKPDSIKVPSEPSILFAMTGSIAQHATTATLDPLIQYVFRLPVEFQVVCLRELIRRNKSVMSHPAIQKWIATSANELF